MKRTRRFVLTAVLTAVVAVALPWRGADPLAAVAGQTATLPERLSDAEFWKLSQDLSEPGGYFQSDNLVSNEIWFPWIIPELLARTKPGGGVYLGVGPEQNFNYIAVLQPKMVFITDIRRGNLHMHLLYKALFEMSNDRAEFLSRLFVKPRPSGLSAKSSGADLANAFWDQPTDTGTNNDHAAYKKHLGAVLEHLTKTRKLPLSQFDIEGIDYIYYSFYWFGPLINYSSSQGRGGGNMVSYGDLMLATDAQGGLRHFLSSENFFRVIKDLHLRNLIVPVVGDFAGPKALRAVGDYIRQHGSTVTAFYLSNVEQYLERNGVWHTFCANVATMPLTPASTFIRSTQGGGRGRGLVNSLGAMQQETSGCRERSSRQEAVIR